MKRTDKVEASILMEFRGYKGVGTLPKIPPPKGALKGASPNPFTGMLKN